MRLRIQRKRQTTIQNRVQRVSTGCLGFWAQQLMPQGKVGKLLWAFRDSDVMGRMQLELKDGFSLTVTTALIEPIDRNCGN